MNFLGQFTQPWDKRQPYESDIRVPFFVRGPKIPEKTISNYPISAVDILPTILDLSGIEQDRDFDGKSFKEFLFKSENVVYDRHILVEYWGEASPNTIDPQCFFAYDNNLAVNFFLLLVLLFCGFFRNVQKTLGVNVKILKTIHIPVF